MSTVQHVRNNEAVKARLTKPVSSSMQKKTRGSSQMVQHIKQEIITLFDFILNARQVTNRVKV